MDRNTVLCGQNPNAKQRDEHANHFVPGRALQAKQHGQHQDVNRTHADNDGRVADGREMKSYREANLIYGYSEKTQIEKYPKVARRELAAPQSLGFRKGRHSRTEQIRGNHDGARENYAEGRHRQWRQV